MKPVFDRWLTPELRLRRWRTPPVTFNTGYHRSLELAMPLQGSLHYQVGNQAFELGRDTLMVLPGHHEHQTRCPVDAEAVSLWVDESVVSDALNAAQTRLKPGTMRAPALSSLLQVLLQEAAQPSPSPMVVDGVLQATLGLLTRDGDRTVAAADPRIQRAVDYIEANYREALRIQKLAQVARLSRYHFTRCFAAATGMSPSAYISARRLRAAAELLRRPTRSITAIALDVGFSDPSRFSRAFRAQYGVLPSEYASRFGRAQNA